MIAILQNCNFGDQNLVYKEPPATKSDIQSRALPECSNLRLALEKCICRYASKNFFLAKHIKIYSKLVSMPRILPHQRKALFVFSSICDTGLPEKDNLDIHQPMLLENIFFFFSEIYINKNMCICNK